MDEQTKNYRKAQFNKVKIERPEYCVKVKFVHPYSGETFWMDLTHLEFDQIKKLLSI